MKTVLSFLVLILSLVPTATVHAKEQGQVTQPAAGSALRKAVLDGLRPSIEKDIKQKVIFIVDTIRVSDDWAFVEVTPVQPDSKPIDFQKTKYKEPMEEGMFDGATTYALLRKKDDQWVVLTFQIGPTDVCWDGWDKAPYNCPRKILPYGDETASPAKETATPAKEAPNLVGEWIASYGRYSDTVTFKADGTYVCVTESRRGNQENDGKVAGTWKLDGNNLTRTMNGHTSTLKIRIISPTSFEEPAEYVTNGVLVYEKSQLIAKPAPVPAANQNQITQEKLAFIDGESNFRTEPTAKSAVKFQPRKGTTGTLLERNGKWIKIELENGDSGWAHESNLKEVD